MERFTLKDFIENYPTCITCNKSNNFIVSFGDGANNYITSCKYIDSKDKNIVFQFKTYKQDAYLIISKKTHDYLIADKHNLLSKYKQSITVYSECSNKCPSSNIIVSNNSDLIDFGGGTGKLSFFTISIVNLIFTLDDKRTIEFFSSNKTKMTKINDLAIPESQIKISKFIPFISPKENFFRKVKTCLMMS